MTWAKWAVAQGGISKGEATQNYKIKYISVFP